MEMISRAIVLIVEILHQLHGLQIELRSLRPILYNPIERGASSSGSNLLYIPIGINNCVVDGDDDWRKSHLARPRRELVRLDQTARVGLLWESKW